MRSNGSRGLRTLQCVRSPADLTCFRTEMSSNAVYYDPDMDSPKLCQDIFSILELQFLSGTLHPSFPAASSAGKVRILSIDGRAGDVAVASLLHLESTIRRLSGDPNSSLSSYIDLVVASGSGALLASLLFVNNLSAEKASLLLSEIQLQKSKTRTRLGRLFKKESKVVDKVFGEATLKDASKPLLITCYDLNTGAPFVFSRADAVEADMFDFKIRDVCEAVTCQRKVKKEVRSVDGETRIQVLDVGTSTNPASVGITHVMYNKQEFPFVNRLDDIFVMSIGGNGACASDAVSVAEACQADMVDQAVAMAFGRNRKSNYIRIQENGVNAGSTPEHILFEPSVESVMFQGKKLMKESNADRLGWAAEMLLKEQQRRQLGKIPTIFIKPAATPARTSSSSAMTLTTLTGSSESPRY